MSTPDNSIQSTLVENRVFPPSEATAKAARISGMEGYNALCAEAENDFEGFWARLARENLSWNKPFTQVLDESNAPFYKWFADGELNASYNCLDRHLGTPTENKKAIIFESDDGKVTNVTYKELHAKVSQFANALKDMGVQKGDRVVIYMPMTVEGVVAMQACARIGATHSVVFGGFSAKSLQERIQDAGAVAVITANYQLRGGKELPLKSIVDEGLAMGGCDSIKNVIVYQRTPTACNMVDGRDSLMHEVTAKANPVCEPEFVGAEHPLFVLYTSGSTGKPKGVQHSTGGYLLWAKLTMDWTFDLQPVRRVLVHRRHRLDHRPHLRHLRPAGRRRDAGRVRRHPDLPERRPLLADDRKAQGHDFLHRAHRHPLADQGRRRRCRRASGPLRPEQPAHPRFGRRADQPRSLDVVLQAHRRRALPGGRYLLADRNRRPHDHAAAWRHAAGARQLHAAAARHHGRHRR